MLLWKNFQTISGFLYFYDVYTTSQFVVVIVVMIVNIVASIELRHAGPN